MWKNIKGIPNYLLVDENDIVRGVNKHYVNFKKETHALRKGEGEVH